MWEINCAIRCNNALYNKSARCQGSQCKTFLQFWIHAILNTQSSHNGRILNSNKIKFSRYSERTILGLNRHNKSINWRNIKFQDILYFKLMFQKVKFLKEMRMVIKLQDLFRLLVDFSEMFIFLNLSENSLCLESLIKPHQSQLGHQLVMPFSKSALLMKCSVF